MSSETFTFTFEQDEKTIVAAMKARPPAGFPSARGQSWASLIKLVQCVMLGLGALGFGVAVEFLLTGQPGINFWATAVGIVLLYVAIFGTLLVIIPVMARRALATRANQGPIIMTLSASGLDSKMNHFQSHVDWAALEAVTRTKTAFIFWLGGNRPSLPFAAFEDAAQVEALDAALKTWMDTSR